LPGSEVYEPLRKRLSQQLAVVSDEEMSYWARHGTEVVTRVRINDETGTVEDGALWTEEALPSESVLWSLVMISDSRQRENRRTKYARAEDLDKKFGEKLAEHPRIFLGGDRTVGRGLVALRRKEGSNGTVK
jgi:CRISPR-associated protein Cmr4